MSSIRKVLILAACSAFLVGAAATVPTTPRSPATVRAYRRACKLKKTPTHCQIDHRIPLHCGGPDTVENLWLLCGPLLDEKEYLERNCKLVPFWLGRHPVKNRCEREE